MTGDLIEVARFVSESAWDILAVFLLSVSLGVLVQALRFDGAIHQAFSSRVALSIVLATAVGAFSPFCSCTVIPLVAGLLIGGVSLAPVMAFWVPRRRWTRRSSRSRSASWVGRWRWHASSPRSS